MGVSQGTEPTGVVRESNGRDPEAMVAEDSQGDIRWTFRRRGEYKHSWIISRLHLLIEDRELGAGQFTSPTAIRLPPRLSDTHDDSLLRLLALP